MASPNDGRRSYARRSQYTAFAAYVVAATGVIAGLLSAIIWVVDPVGFGNLRMVVSEAFAPVSRTVSTGATEASGAGDALSNWWMAGSQNADLKKELADTRQALIRARSMQAENRELRALLGIARADPKPVAVARLLSTSASSTRRFAILDAGFADGVRTGQPVRGAYGLIGRTLEVGPSVSRVLLITDRDNVVPGKRSRDGLALLVSGRGDDLLEVRTLNNASNVLRVGDLVVASGSGGLYQPHTPIATIVRLTSEGALAAPLMQPTATEGVVVEPASAADVDVPPPSATEEVATKNREKATAGAISNTGTSR